MKKIIVIGVVIVLIAALVLVGFFTINSGKKETKKNYDKLEASDINIAGICLGMKKSEVIEKIGDEFEITEEEIMDYDGYMHYSMIYSKYNTTIDIINDGNKEIVNLITIDGESSLTATRNLKINSTIDDIINSFKEEEIRINNDNEDENRKFVWVGMDEEGLLYEYSDDGLLLFVVDDGKVTEICLTHGAE